MITNLALSCPSCNLHKAGRFEFPDPDSGSPTPLFNPRKDRWVDHGRWEDFDVVPLTAKGRVTCEAMPFNHPRRILIRQAEAMFGLFPPEEE